MLPKSNSHFIFSIFYAISFAFSPFAYADLLPPVPSPYSFGPEGRTVQDLTEFAKPNQMFSILPNHQVPARDKFGNRVYFTSDGVMSCKVAQDGTMTFSINGHSKELNTEGQLLQETVARRGTNIVEIKNDKGTVIGYQELNMGGQAAKEYDYEGNLTKTYTYDKYGKNIQFVLDELTMTKTIYNKNSQPEYDVNEEGAKTAFYTYDDKNRLILKTDWHNNKTYFDNGNMTHTVDQFGNVLERYFYKEDAGRYVLDTSVNLYGHTTYYRNGKAMNEKDTTGAVIKEYVYDGLTLAYTVDTQRKEITWYDVGGKPRATTTTDGYLATSWIYSKGKLVGVWDETTQRISAYINGVEIGRYMVMTGKPTAEQIQELIDNGSLKKQYTS